MLVVNANRQMLSHLLQDEADLKVRTAYTTPYFDNAQLGEGTSLVMECDSQEIASWFVSNCKRLAQRIREAFPVQEIRINHKGQGVAIALSELFA